MRSFRWKRTESLASEFAGSHASIADVEDPREPLCPGLICRGNVLASVGLDGGDASQLLKVQGLEQVLYVYEVESD